MASIGWAIRNVGWNVDGRDWAARGPRAITKRVVPDTLNAGDGAVVLLHGWPWPTPLALPDLIRALAGAGAEFVTVDQLPSLPVRALWDSASA